MGSRGKRPPLRRPAGVALAVWAVAFVLLAGATATACDLVAKLAADTRTPYVGQTVHFDASGSHGNDEIVAYKFSFGDGAGTGWQPSPKASHAYPTPGNVTASVTVKDHDGNTASATLKLTVRPLTPDVVPVFAVAVPLDPLEGEAIHVTAVLLNRGNGTATSGRVDVFDLRPDGTTVDTGNASLAAPLAPLATVNVTVGPFPAVQPGNHTLSVVVTNVTPTPSTTAGHVLNLTLVVVPRPVRTPKVVPVAAVLNPGEPVEGDAVNLTIFLLNQGNATAESAEVTVTDVRPNGTAAFLGVTELTPPLPPIAVASVAFGPFLASGVGDHVLELTVTNVTPVGPPPSNATLNVTMVVAAAPPPPTTDLVPAFATVDASRPVEGDAVNLTVVLVNRGTEPVTAANLTATDVRPNGSLVPLGTLPVPVPLAPATPVALVFGPFEAEGVGTHTLLVAVTDVRPPPASESAATLSLAMIVFPSTGPPPPPPTYPDLVPIAATLAPSEPMQGDAVNLTVYLLNRGGATATSADLTVYDGGPNGSEFLGTVAMPSPLAPSDVEAVPFGPFTAGDPGRHVLQILVTDVRPPQTSGADHVLSLPMNVSAASTSPRQGGKGGTFDVGALVIAALAGAGIAAAAGAAVYFLRPAPAGPLEPPPPDPPDYSPRPIWPP